MAWLIGGYFWSNQWGHSFHSNPYSLLGKLPRLPPIQTAAREKEMGKGNCARKKKMFFRLKYIFPPCFCRQKSVNTWNPAEFFWWLFLLQWSWNELWVHDPQLADIKHADSAKNDLTKERMLHGLTQKSPGKVWCSLPQVCPCPASIRWELWFHYYICELCLWTRVFHHLSAISKDGIHWMSKMTFAFYQIALHNFILSFKLNSNRFAVKFTFEQTKVNLFFVWKSSHLCKNFAYFPRNGY